MLIKKLGSEQKENAVMISAGIIADASMSTLDPPGAIRPVAEVCLPGRNYFPLVSVPGMGRVNVFNSMVPQSTDESSSLSLASGTTSSCAAPHLVPK